MGYVHEDFAGLASRDGYDADFSLHLAKTSSDSLYHGDGVIDVSNGNAPLATGWCKPSANDKCKQCSWSKCKYCYCWWCWAFLQLVLLEYYEAILFLLEIKTDSSLIQVLLLLSQMQPRSP